MVITIFNPTFKSDESCIGFEIHTNDRTQTYEVLFHTSHDRRIAVAKADSKEEIAGVAAAIAKHLGIQPAPPTAEQEFGVISRLQKAGMKIRRPKPRGFG
jgi:hypothetical protein